MPTPSQKPDANTEWDDGREQPWRKHFSDNNDENEAGAEDKVTVVPVNLDSGGSRCGCSADQCATRGPFLAG